MDKQKIEECARILSAAAAGVPYQKNPKAFAASLAGAASSGLCWKILLPLFIGTREAFAAARSEADALAAVESCRPLFEETAARIEDLRDVEEMATVDTSPAWEVEKTKTAKAANKAARAAVAALRAAVAGDHVEPPPPSGLSNRERRAAAVTKFGAVILEAGPRLLRFELSGKVYAIRGEKAAHAVGRLLDAAPGEWVDFKDGDGKVPNVKAYFSPRQGKNGERVQGSDAEKVGSMIEGGAARGRPGAYRLRPL